VHPNQTFGLSDLEGRLLLSNDAPATSLCRAFQIVVQMLLHFHPDYLVGMSFFTASDDDDINCRWSECNDPKCMGAGKVHYHKTVIWSCPAQSNTLDSWFDPKHTHVSSSSTKLSSDEVDSLKPKVAPKARWSFKHKGLGRVKRFRVHTNWRTDPYESSK